MDTMTAIFASEYAQRYEARKGRLERVIAALRANSRKTIHELAHELGTFPSTVQDDMKFLRKHLWFTVIPLPDVGKPIFVHPVNVDVDATYEPMTLPEGFEATTLPAPDVQEVSTHR